MIKFNNISKKFKNSMVLNDISFNINKGELVVLIGPSGCGKTTTLKMINRLIKPTSGKIYINDENIEEKNVIKLRRNIGYVIQQTGLFPHMTIKENIEIIAKLEKLDPKKIEEKTIELMAMVGLEPEDYLYRYPTQLSGGQQQRIGVARAFALNPDIILMDEPFSALDPITRSQLQDELGNIQAKFKKTIVFVTHDMDEAIKIADRICIMNNGDILQYDTPENILKKPANDFVSDFVGKNRIWNSPEFIKAKDIMITNPITNREDASIFKCIERMRSNRVDTSLILNEDKKLIGIARIKDIKSSPNKDTPIKHVMKTDFLKAHLDDSLIELLEKINETNLTSIPVVDSNDKLVGILTTASLLTTLSAQFIDTEEVL